MSRLDIKISEDTRVIIFRRTATGKLLSVEIVQFETSHTTDRVMLDRDEIQPLIDALIKARDDYAV